MIKLKNIVGKKPKFFNLDEIEATDIDEGLDFEVAKILYKKTFG